MVPVTTHYFNRNSNADGNLFDTPMTFIPIYSPFMDNEGKHRIGMHVKKQGSLGKLIQSTPVSGTQIINWSDSSKSQTLHRTGGIGFVSGKRSVETLKIECLKKECIESDINIVGLTEVKKNQRNVPNENTIWNETAGWRDNRRSQISQIYHYPAESDFLVGGITSIVFGKAVFRISDQGLGR